jgi:sugar PTS system EIIA component
MAGALTAVTPVTGKVVAMADVPDPVFSAGLVGPGVAIEPDDDAGRDVVSPLAGTVAKLHPHAFVIAGPDGRGVLVHLGIDTVQLAGEGFTLHVAEGDAVEVGQLLVSWSPAAVAEGGRSTLVPIVALDAAPDALSTSAEVGAVVQAGDELFTVA